MEINTKFWGRITVDEGDVITFPRGLPGFEHLKRFVIWDDGESLFKGLQSVDDAGAGFVIVDPALVVEGYAPAIPEAARRALRLEDGQDPEVYVITVVPEDITKIRVNLKAPVVINPRAKLGEQVVLDDGRYPLRYGIYPLLAAANA